MNQSPNAKPPPEVEVDVEGYRPSLPDWGVYLYWPEDGEACIHPEDVEVAKQLIPSRRVLLRNKWDGEFYWLEYGDRCIRVRPTMWVAVPAIDLHVNQQVEVLSHHGENDPGVFRIHEILFAVEQGKIEYFIKRGDLPLERSFDRADLRPIHVRHHLRVGYFQHEQPKSDPPEDLERLDVGPLLDD